MTAAVCVEAVKQKIWAQAERIRADIEGRSHACARSREWANMSDDVRMCVMLLAGLDGDLGQLATRKFAEFSTDEKIAVQVAIRAIYAGLTASPTLRARAA